MGGGDWLNGFFCSICPLAFGLNRASSICQRVLEKLDVLCCPGVEMSRHWVRNKKQVYAGPVRHRLSITSPAIRPSGQMLKKDPFSLHTRMNRMAGGRDEVGGQVGQP